MKTGIYTITSPSGKRYVGSASNFLTRWSGHRSHLRRGIHNNAKLQAAWNKYGEGAMIFERVELCDKCDLLAVEQRWIDGLRPEYNINMTAGRNTGMRHSDDAKQKIREASIGRKHSPETRARQSAVRLGIVFTDEHKANLSASCKGKPKGGRRAETLTVEHRRAIANKMRGVPKSPEAKANMLAARLARMVRERAAKAT